MSKSNKPPEEFANLFKLLSDIIDDESKDARLRLDAAKQFLALRLKTDTGEVTLTPNEIRERRLAELRTEYFFRNPEDRTSVEQAYYRAERYAWDVYTSEGGQRGALS